MKRIVIALLLAVCLTLAFAVPAFAATPPWQAGTGLATALDKAADTPAYPVLLDLQP